VIVTGENRITGRKTCPCATLSTSNPTWTDLGSIPYLRVKRLAKDRLSRGTAVEINIDKNYILIFSPYRAVNTLPLRYKNQSVNAV